MLNFCPFCGTKIVSQEARFCMGCGKSLAAFMVVADEKPATQTVPEPPVEKISNTAERPVSQKISDAPKISKAPASQPAPKEMPNVTSKKSSPKKSSPVRARNDSSMEQELAKCRESAEEGYQLASNKYNEIKDTLDNESRDLSKIDSEQNQVDRIQNTQLVDEQKSELKKLVDEVKLIRDDIQNLRERSKDFSIVVYGRTMAGKSTLMEILTHGNGSSIGRGAQRTTLDVRDYYWNGLKITDVPGISAFGGAADERLALEAAKSADLILFLLTSDAPQPDEAEKLAQLKSFGKPVLGVINVKMSFNINDELDIEDLQEKLADTSTIDATIDQFKKFSVSHNQDWSGIKFVATHLLSAYQSQDTNPKVFEISRFVEVEDFILEKVRNDGRFLRIKTFADSVAVPMSNIILKIYEHSATTLLESDVWFDKRRQLQEWRKNFLERAQKKLDGTYDTLAEELNAAIYNFAENHYEDDKVNEHWQQRFQSLRFDEKYQNLLRELAGECERKRKELSDELTQELSYAFSGSTRTNVSLESTTTWGKNIAAALPLLALVPGVGWGIGLALGAVSILGNLFFSNKAEKIREAKEKLRNDLTTPSFDMLGKMHSQVIEVFNEEILHKGIDEFTDLLAGYQFMLARLGNSQAYIAGKLFGEFSDLNAKLFQEAIDYKGAGFISNVESIARVPGELTVAFADRSNLNTQELGDLLGEKISIVQPSKDLVETVKNVLGCDFDVERYPLDFAKENQDAEEAFAVFPKGNVAPTSFKIAQQIAFVPIIEQSLVQKNREAQKKRDNSRTTSNSTQKNSGGGRKSGNFNGAFEKVDEMIADFADEKSILNELYVLECKARNKRDAEFMNRVADYYEQIGEIPQARAIREEANTFSGGNSTQKTSSNNTSTTASNRRNRRSSSGMTFIPSGKFSEDFAKIERFLTSSTIDNDFISDALDAIEDLARSRRNKTALNFVAEYREKLRNR